MITYYLLTMITIYNHRVEIGTRQGVTLRPYRFGIFITFMTLTADANEIYPK
jgi:hypothetical protein